MRAHAETCPHYLILTDDRYAASDPARGARRRASRRRSALPTTATRCGRAWPTGTLDLVATDHVADRLAIEKGEAAKGVPFDQISQRCAGHRDAPRDRPREGVVEGRISIERMVDVLSTTPARLFGLGRKGAIEVGRDADLVLFDPVARRTIRAADLHHTSDYTPYEGLEVTGAVRSVFVRGRAVIRDGAFVGDRGYGRFVERGGIVA